VAVNVEKSGEFQVIYAGPYTGFDTSRPENLIADTASPATNDFIFKNAELRSRPAFAPTQIVSPVPANHITAVGSLSGILWAVATNGLYSYNFGSGLWTLVTGSALASVQTWRVLGKSVAGVGSSSILYLSTTAGHLSTWDGSTFTLDTATLAGPINMGGMFVDELDNHLIMANMSEGGISYTNRIRWSATGLPGQWDPTVNTNAGFNDFFDVPDSITGLMMLGRVGYILRNDGITEMAPTGRGSAPFEFNHLWASQNGIGNNKFFGYAQYGTTGIIIARDNIYSIISYQIQAIGGGARDNIYADLSSTSVAVGLSNVWGAIVPYTASGVVPDRGTVSSNGVEANNNYCYLMFMLFINLPGAIGARVWVYSFDDNSWTPWNLPGYNVTGKPSLCVDSFGAPTLLVPVKNLNNNQSSLGLFQVGVYNDPAQGSSHSYKVEDIIANYVPTIRRVVITYRDLGVANITVTINGTDDSGTVVTQSAAATIGTGGAPGILKTAFVDIGITCYRPQLTISRAANGGPVSISTVTMIGRVDATTTL
jgi:hypothetical protein